MIKGDFHGFVGVEPVRTSGYHPNLIVELDAVAVFSSTGSDLETKVVSDPRAAVAIDVAFLPTIPALPGAWLVSGLVYNVATGRVEIVVPPAGFVIRNHKRREQ